MKFSFAIVSSTIVFLFSVGTFGFIEKRETGDFHKTVPRFEDSDCLVKLPAKAKARCGFLIVRENRERKNNRTIRLPIIIVKSIAENPAPDPILYTAGGPGAGSLGRARGYRGLQRYLKERDFIVFEQRGTLYAEPSLKCPEVDVAIRQSAIKKLDFESSLKEEAKAAKACRTRLVKEGIDLSSYDSVASAADIEDLRRVLGYEKLNLFGISYSTRLMINFMRDYPDSARSAVLDSVLPPSVNWDETGIDGVVRSLNLLFDNCAADEVCNEKYPELRSTFYSLVQRLNKNPIIIEVKEKGFENAIPVEITGVDVINLAYDSLNYPHGIANLPSSIYSASKGNYEALIPMAEYKLKGDGFIWGMRYSVWCREEMPFQSRRRILLQTQRYSNLKGFKIQGAMHAICEIWNVSPAKPIENEPVVNNVPTLVLAGEYDPNTPPVWGRLVSENFSNSYFYKFKGMGHLINFSSRCGNDMIAEFFSKPNKAPNSDCMKEMNGVKFK